jgi:hypothetical protein
MDYVAAGQVIVLGPQDRIVLGYMRSCWRETITGGTVTVGEERSAVERGEVERTRVACDASRAALGARESTQSAATVFRSLRKEPPPARPPPPTLHGRAPVFEVGDARGVLLIERLDLAGERLEVVVAAPALVRERFVDLARTTVVLAPGASYAVRLGSRQAEFKVDADALPGDTPVVGRLLRLD